MQHHRYVLLAGLLAILSSIITPALAAERVPGTCVSMLPPADFQPTERYPGFDHAASQSSIMVSVLEAPVEKMKQAMDKQNLATRGMRLISSTQEQANDQEVLVLHVQQDAGGSTFIKWILIAGDQENTVMIVASTPKSQEAMAQPLRASLLTATWDFAMQLDPFEGLPYRVTPGPKLKYAMRMHHLLIFNETGSKTAKPPEAMMIVGLSFQPRAIDDLKAFSEHRIREIHQIKDLADIQGRTIEVAGEAAYEIVARATDGKTNTQVCVYQVIAPDPGGYYIMQGFVPIERAQEWLPAFQAVAHSLVRIDSQEKDERKKERI